MFRKGHPGFYFGARGMRARLGVKVPFSCFWSGRTTRISDPAGPGSHLRRQL